MKILFISRRFYPDIIGGGQISAFYLAKAAKMAGHDVYVCTFTNNKQIIVDVLEGITIYRIPLPNLKFSKILSNLDYMYLQMALLSSKIIKKINPDILHLLNFESVPLASIYYKLRFKKKIVATVNGPLFGCFTQNGLDYNEKVCINCKLVKRFRCSTKQWGLFKGIFYYIYSIYFINMLKISYKFVDKFFAVSSAMVPLLENMSIPSNKISVIHNPVKKLKITKRNIKKELKIQNKKIILYVGRLSKYKGVQHIISAIKNIDNVVLLIIGTKRDYYFELLKQVKNLKIENKVKFLGFINNNEIGDYVSATDLVILPCQLYESLSRMLIESLSLGIPLIATNIGGNKDIVLDNKTGFLINLKDVENLEKPIRQILENKQLQTKFEKRSLEHFKNNFSINVISKKLDIEYSSLFF